jgi:hypothetical protein
MAVDKPEITPPSNSHHLRDGTEAGIEPSVGSVGDSYDCEKICAVWEA